MVNVIARKYDVVEADMFNHIVGKRRLEVKLVKIQKFSTTGVLGVSEFVKINDTT
ncbi:hypothetical protein OTSGILL_0230 [Orientia tsutsugamushi str. Gilliam]|uniref:Uncharacterized protein n=1 Tax=Orientia tsutsugamushi str. Gilliam TaxID=1359184 RepID=A0A0F3MEV2_ORITS|nr:hypothetical protein OTSGILL_0230 [Orientia tsutsugamushi str. Gilliam]